MPSNPAKLPLSELLELIIDHRGKTPNKMGFDDFSQSGVPVLSAKHVKTDGLIDVESMRYASPEMYKKWMTVEVQGGDIILTSEAPMGEVFYLQDDKKYVLGQRVFGLRPNPELINPKYLAAWLASSEGQRQMAARASGSTVQGIRQSELLKIEVDLPSKEEQEEIANVRFSLTNKISLNRRINQTLEAMAQAIFKSWFVDFDPVKAKIAAIEQGEDPLRAAMRAISGKTDLELDQMPREHHDQLAATAALFPDEMEDSELGEIPKGWEVEVIGSYFDLTMGQSPPGNTYNETGEGIPFYQGRTDFGARFPTERVYCTAPTRLAKKGDVLVSVRAPVGDINVAVSDCAIGRGVAAVRYKHPSFALYVLRHQEPAFKRFESDGTVFGSINKKQFESLPFVVAPDELVRRFQSLVGSLDEKIESNEWQMRNLAILRDALLPKLLSGELSVENIPIEVAH